MIGKAHELVENGEKVAMVIVTNQEGSTPAEPGKMMIVRENGTFLGTIGGGRLEYNSLAIAKDCIKSEISKSFKFDLKEDLGMTCGGFTEIFIKILKPEAKLVIVGGGHIGKVLEKLALLMKFNTIIIDNRPEMCNKDLFPNAKELILGDIEEECKKYKTNNNTYIVITSHGHLHDEVALKGFIKKDYKYIGVIGSKNKVNKMFDNLIKDGISKELLDKVNSPIGLAIGGNSPEDIALSIMAEIIMTKNKGQGIKMKDKV